MKVQPISNFDERMQQYKQECVSFYLGEMPGMFLLFLVMSLALFYWVNRLLGPLDFDWRVVSVGFALSALVPPIYLMRPERPSPEDVLRDQALRRAAGMDDSVSK